MPLNAKKAPKTLLVRVYRGKDFPQMDSKKFKEKEYLDPYCIVKYSGQEFKTKVKKGTYDPEWNEEMIFTTYVSFKIVLIYCWELSFSCFVVSIF